MIILHTKPDQGHKSTRRHIIYTRSSTWRLIILHIKPDHGHRSTRIHIIHAHLLDVWLFYIWNWSWSLIDSQTNHTHSSTCCLIILQMKSDHDNRLANTSYMLIYLTSYYITIKILSLVTNRRSWSFTCLQQLYVTKYWYFNFKLVILGAGYN